MLRRLLLLYVFAGIALLLLGVFWQNDNYWVVIAFVLVALNGLMAVLVYRRWFRPIHLLQDTIQRERDGDTSARLLPVGESGVDELIRTYNSLIDDRRATIDALVLERDRLANVFLDMADGVIITDPQSKVLQINPAATRMLATTANDAIGRSFAEVVRHHQLIELWQKCARTHLEQADSVVLSSSGTFLQAIVTAPVEAEINGYLVILQDLTQVRHLQTMRQDFVSNLSHELRTPLASLRAVVETLQGGALDDPPAAQRFLERAAIEIDTLTQMVQELLELSRIESGKVPLRLSAVPATSIIEPSVERLAPQAERANIAIKVTVADDLPLALADATRVERVMTNLLHNALKFSPEDGRVSIDVTYDERKDVLLFRVQDNGVGIADNDIPRIFERFYKTDRARTHVGTGLGLAIAKHIIQAHGGSIWVKSKVGKGSTFYFTLPTAGEFAKISAAN
jgi:two-component system phosphate regulon sensor histidine kinase PhoR